MSTHALSGMWVTHTKSKVLSAPGEASWDAGVEAWKLAPERDVGGAAWQMGYAWSPMTEGQRGRREAVRKMSITWRHLRKHRVTLRH